MYVTLQSLTCFEHQHAHLQEDKFLLSQHLVSSFYVNGCTEGDDTRCCDNTICPPEDGHVDVRNMSQIVM